MREYDDYSDDSIRLYTPVLQRVIILAAVIIAVPVLMWTITTFVRSYVARPRVPALEHVASTAPSIARRVAVSIQRYDARPPATVDRELPFVKALREAASPGGGTEVMSVGRDGASDAVSFLRVGVPAVEFGPVGGGHHGPEEWVSVSSLETYRQALESFLRAIPGRLDD